MAIAAANVALANLLDDCSSAESIAHEFHHGVTFRCSWTMVEVENSEVGVAAVYAGMGQEELGLKSVNGLTLRQVPHFFMASH
ncbi:MULTISPECIES: hypothetical protein [unclassified Microbacterium]|uniref:hypothetical protein n=1 Tax=unclassified Microbacterium TaxID=2609290 RepID=UPI001DB7DEF3|nr:MULTISPECIES: hypothetical protein [unclassified Microbacterium]CAH0193525.1 hypothetical protein SRABI121_02305 [Microbacterium sp. Bi121]HWK78273.1 hypothetical protein [Microbacterium sp.]